MAGKQTDKNQNQETQTEELDEFELAFNEPDPDEPGDNGKGKTVTDTPGADDDDAAAAAAKAEAEAAAKKKAEEDAAAAADPAKEAAELKARLTEVEHKTKSWEGRLSASDRQNQTLREENASLAKKLAEYEQKTKDGGETPADVDAELEKLKKEYPDYTGPLWAVIEKALKKSAAAVDSKIDTAVKTALKPLEERAANDARERHFSAIGAVHSDWKEIAAGKDLADWIASKPAYLKPGLQRVLDQGTAGEIIELLTDFKASKAPPADPAAEAAAKKKAEDEAAAEAKRKKKLEDAGAVKSRTGGMSTGGKNVDADDFDGAWKEAPE